MKSLEEMREWLKSQKKIDELFGWPNWRENPNLPHWIKKSNEEDEERNAVIDAILAALEGPGVTKEWIRKVAKTMTSATDPHETLTTEELLAITEGNENYLEKEIRALILSNPAPGKEADDESKEG